MDDDSAPSPTGADLFGGVFDILDSERRHDGFLKLDRYSVRQRRFDGGILPVLSREVMIGGEAVAVLPFDPVRNQIVMIRQARLPAAIGGFAAITTEVVAGIIEPGEAPEEVARREVLEETGLHLLAPALPIVRMLTSPGNTAQAVNLFLGRVDTSEAGGVFGLAEEHEDIEVAVIDFEAFRADVLGARLDNAIALVAGFWLICNLERVRTVWA